MSDFSRDLFTPNSFKSKRGGLRKVFRGHTYALSSRGKKGQAYFLCINLREGCMGRMKFTPEGGKLVTNPHTCLRNARPSAADARTPAARRRRMARQPQGQQSRRRGNPRPRPVQPVPVRLEPQTGPSCAVPEHQLPAEDGWPASHRGSSRDGGRTLSPVPSSLFLSVSNRSQLASYDGEMLEEESNEDVRQLEPVSDATFRQLRMSYIRQKIDIGKLMKEKLKIEIDLLQKKFRPDRNPGANGGHALEPAVNNSA